MPRFDDRVAIVTGAASGIGRALAEALAREGAQVAVTDIDGPGAEAVVRGIVDAGGRAVAREMDVRDAGAVRDVVHEIHAGSGRLDYMFNNAGIACMGEVRDMTLAHWKRTVDVNLHGVIHGVDAAYPLMVKQGFGHIVNMSSIAGLVSLPYITPYVTTKFAIYGLSTSLQAEAAQYGVGVSVVCPSAVRTRIFENIVATSEARRRVDQRLAGIIGIPPEHVAERVLSGVLRNRTVINIGLSTTFLWWLQRLAPWFVMGSSRLATRLVPRKEPEGPPAALSEGEGTGTTDP